MNTIWKQQVRFEDAEFSFVVRFPEGSEILSVGAQYGVVTIWAFVRDSDAPLVNYKIRSVFTGSSCPDCDIKDFLGTVQAKDPKYHNEIVYHLFKTW